MKLTDVILQNLPQLMTGLVGSILIFKGAGWLADNLPYWPLVNHFRDVDNPLTYKIIGVVLVFVTIMYIVCYRFS